MFDKLRNNSRIIIYIVVAVFVVSGGFMGFGAYMNRSGSSSGQSSADAIATVNGDEISYQEYMNVLRNQSQQTSQLSSTQLLSFRLNVLNSLIEWNLVLQKAEEKGVNVNISQDEINNSIKQFRENRNMSEEELNTALEEQENYSMEQFRSEITEQLRAEKTYQKMIEESYSNVKVSEKEIREKYNEQYKDAEEKPDFSDKKGEIKNNLLQQKQNEAYNNWLTNLKAEAKIEIYNYSLRGMKAYQNQNYEKAIKNFEKALENSKAPSSYIYLAKSYSNNNMTDKAKEIYKKSVEKYPDNWEIRLNFAEYYRKIDKKDLALKQYDKTSELIGESNFMAHYQLYQGYKSIGAEEKAKAEMDKIMKIQQDMMQQQQNNQQETNEKNTKNNTE